MSETTVCKCDKCLTTVTLGPGVDTSQWTRVKFTQAGQAESVLDLHPDCATLFFAWLQAPP
jgi:hypothetical protein